MAQNYGLVRSMDELKALIDYLYKVHEAGNPIGFDTEGGYLGLDRPKGSLDISWPQQFVCGFSLSGHPNMARYVPVAHDVGGANLPEGRVWEAVKPLLEEAQVVAHNAKFEIKNLQTLAAKGRGPNIRLNIKADTMLLAYVLSEWQRVGQKDLVEEIFGHKQKHIQELFPNLTAKQLTCLRFNVLELNQDVVEYACEDAAWCLALYHRLKDKAQTERSFMTALEHQIMDLMADVELYGVYVDWEGLQSAANQAPGFVQRMEKAVRNGLSQLVGRDLSGLNLGSATQLRDVLYEEAPIGMGLRASRTSDKTGKPSTDAIALEKLSREILPVKKLLELREVNNLFRRLEKWLKEYGAYSEDCRVHASYGQTIVPTGRFAANEPAIQQCPKEWRWASTILDFEVWKDEDSWQQLMDTDRNGQGYWNGNFRDFIIAAPGSYLLTYDYSQIELRVLAGVSQEPALLNAFNTGLDVHTLTAAKMLGKRVEEINSKDRAVGKTMNFALIYGMGPKSLSDRLALTQDRAHELYDEYFAQFPAVSMWIERTKNEGKNRGYVETVFGRKMTAWELQSANRAIYAKGLRVLGNYPIQGGAADYMKIAMVRVSKKLKELGWWGTKCTIVMNQHDSLSFEVSNDLNPAEVRAVIESCVVFAIPNFPRIVADWELGQRWGSSTKWENGMQPEWNGEFWSLLAAEVGVDESRVSAVPAKETVPSRSLGAVLPSCLIIEMANLPTADQLDALLEFFISRPGPNKVLLRTSKKEIDLWDGTSVGLSDHSKISLLVPGAVCRLPADEIDVSALTDDLSL